MTEKYFRQIVGVFKNYKAKEKSLNDELAKAQKSGNFSSNYLSSMASKNNDELKRIHSESCNTLNSIREELHEALLSENDLLSRTINPKLQAVLDSGITLTLDEWSALAQKCKDNTVESRLLHDRAANAGITLNNYISTDEALRTADRLIRDVRNSMFGVSPIVAPFKTADEAEMAGGAVYGICTKPSFDCFYTPKNLDEAIKHEYEEYLKSAKPTEADGEAFLSGMGATINSSTLAESSYMDADEAALREEIATLERSKAGALQNLSEKYEPGTQFYKEEAARVSGVFDEQIKRINERISEIDSENEQKTKSRLEEMGKKTTKTVEATADKGELTDTDRAFMKGLGIEPEQDGDTTE